MSKSSRKIRKLKRRAPLIGVVLGILGLSYGLWWAINHPKVWSGRKTTVNIEQKPKKDVSQLLGESDYEQALKLATAGKTDEARSAMQTIAPLDEDGGDPKAHWWLAQDLLANELPLTVATRDLAIDHLEVVLLKDAEIPDARLVLARLYEQGGNSARAIRILSEVAEQDPSARLALAWIYREQGELDEVAVHARAARDYFAKRMEEDRQQRRINLEARWQLADASILLGEQANVEKLISDARNALGADPALCDELLIKMHLTLFDNSLGKGEEGLEAAWGHLSSALELGRDRPDLWHRVAMYAHVSEEKRRSVKGVLEKRLAGGEASGGILYCLGTIAIDEKLYAEAANYFEQAAEKSPEVVEIRNNWAWALSQLPDPPLDKALEIITGAIDDMEKRGLFGPALWETRGQIQSKRAAWSEAVADLEKVLMYFVDDPKVHETLATAYNMLGDTRQAAVHSARAKRITEKP